MAIVIGKVRQVDTTMGGSEGEVVLALPNGATSAHVVSHLGSDFVQPNRVMWWHSKPQEIGLHSSTT